MRPGKAQFSARVPSLPVLYSGARFEGDLIVNLQSERFEFASTNAWANRTGNPQSVGNFTALGGVIISTSHRRSGMARR